MSIELELASSTKILLPCFISLFKSTIVSSTKLLSIKISLRASNLSISYYISSSDISRLNSCMLVLATLLYLSMNSLESSTRWETLKDILIGLKACVIHSPYNHNSSFSKALRRTSLNLSAIFLCIIVTRLHLSDMTKLPLISMLFLRMSLKSESRITGSITTPLPRSDTTLFS